MAERAHLSIGEVLNLLQSEFPDIRVGVTGKAAISNDELAAAFRDGQVATVLAFVLTLALLVTAFRCVVEPLFMLGVLALSLGWTVGVSRRL